MQDANGQFRDLDGVIYELADKWDTLDRNTQRYIATIVAGSRQQSRFLAMVGDSARLQELKLEGENSEDAGLIQYSKTLDSLESKLNQLSTSFQQLYMSIINGPTVKWFIDAAKSIVDLFKNIPSTLLVFVIPLIIAAVRKTISTIGTNMISGYRDANLKVLKMGLARIKTEEVAALASIKRIGMAQTAAASGERMSRMTRFHSVAGPSNESLEQGYAAQLGTASKKFGSKVLPTIMSGLTKASFVAMAISGLEMFRTQFDELKTADEIVKAFEEKNRKS